ncbi:MAG: [protein-PII] uridylyltransferase, partial [Planctomycetes bacterium]|nr:[protein-PII] uridylyltransferase [Planctomycetota bacterium]
DGGATGIQVAAALSASTDAFVVNLVNDALQVFPAEERARLTDRTAVIAVGGSGRGDPAPYSDVDLLFLFSNPEQTAFETLSSRVVRDCWDAKVKLGHAVRNIGETLSIARQETQVATALLEARLLWGSPSLLQTLLHRFRQRVIRWRKRAFTDECFAAREGERLQFGRTATELQPDVKRSMGGLRDIHLIRWIGFIHYGTTDIDSLRLKGALGKADARILLSAQEFLTRLRIDMHFAAGRAQDVLTRDEQLRFARERGYQPHMGQRPVERFMRSYFEHSTAIADVATRFVALHRQCSFVRRAWRSLTTHRLNGYMRIGSDRLEISRRHLETVSGSLEEMLRIHHAAIRYRVELSPTVIDGISRAQPKTSEKLSDNEVRLFLEILGSSGRLGPVLRSMFQTGILQCVVPQMEHARCLLQFNQYHSYTVDEHTLRAVEAVEALANEEGTLGDAYRDIQHKELLHLAVLLHDLGKGFAEDHSEVGRVIAETMAVRLRLPDHHRETLVFLVHKHLRMSHLALRRNFADPNILMKFTKEVGSPQRLRMLYTLTAADLRAVGPKTWTDWKAELLSDLYDRAMLILSGKPYHDHEKRQRARTKTEVARILRDRSKPDEPADTDEWIEQSLDEFPPHYLSMTSAKRIADDLQLIRQLARGELMVEGVYDAATVTCDYRVIVDAELADGCFHRITGALAAKRLEILSAQISPSIDGTVVDSFRVIDRDFSGEVPPERIQQVAEAVGHALKRKTRVKQLFQKHMRFDDDRIEEPVSEQETRVVVDNDSSERCTVIDVFAHDRRGLLYTLARAIYKMGLSVMLAKISTHLDQIVDVFYLTEKSGGKIHDGDRLVFIRRQLLETIEEFERTGHSDYVA